MTSKKSTVFVTVNKHFAYVRPFDGSKFVFIRTDTVIKMSDKKEKSTIEKIRDFKPIAKVLKLIVLKIVLDWVIE
jgi:hypothetical protein